MKKPPLPIVEVIWDDAASLDDWSNMDEIVSNGTAPCRSVGYMTGETQEFICLSGSMHVDPDDLKGSCTIIIPKGLIRERRTLR